MRNRFGFNFQQAITALTKGYREQPIDAPDKRRTGENTWVHSLRTFLRTASEWIPRTEERYWNIYYVSYLASLLHDCREDKLLFPQFQINKKQRISGPVFEYGMSFSKNGEMLHFPLRMTDKEYDILNFQLEALESPEEAMKIHKTQPEESAYMQFEHLHHTVKRLLEKYPDRDGLLAAIFIYRIKIEDRLDNLYTYWTLNGSEKTDPAQLKRKKMKKIRETLTYFQRIEKSSKSLLEILLSSNGQTSFREKYFAYLDSAVDFCYSTLLGASYDEIFGKSINSYLESFEKARDDALITNIDLSDFYDQLNVNPYNGFSTCMIE